MTALENYNECMVEGEESDPIERLRFFLSCALTSQDWLDVEPFIDDVSKLVESKEVELNEYAQGIVENRGADRLLKMALTRWRE